MENILQYHQGCLLGLAVGDAMGYPVDKKSWEEICESYGPNGLLGYDLQNDFAEITSYTQIAAFVCNGLLLNASRGQGDAHNRYMTMALKEWAKSQQFRSGTERTHCWVAQVAPMRRRSCMDTRILDTLAREKIGTPDAPVNYSDSPAGLTAAIPVGLFYDMETMEVSRVGELGAEAVAMLQGEPSAFVSGAVAAYAIAGILHEPKLPLQQQFSQAMEAVKAQFAQRFPEGVKAVDALLQKAFDLAADPDITPLVAMTLLECTTAAQCLAGAVYACMIHMANFDEALIVAVNHSGRSCAVGALTGAIMGAKLGLDALPGFYLESLEVGAVLEELGKDLTSRRQLKRIFDDDWDCKYVQGIPAR